MIDSVPFRRKEPSETSLEATAEGSAAGMRMAKILPLLYFTALGLVATYPLCVHLSNKVASGPDNYQYTWMLRWWWDNLAQYRSPLHAPQFYVPEGMPLASSETGMLWLILGSPLCAVWGSTAALNTLLLLSYPLVGLGGYRLGYQLTHRRDAGLITGTILALSPFHMAHVIEGHLPFVGLGFLSFALCEFFLLIQSDERKRRLRACAFVWLTLVSAWQLGVLLLFAVFLSWGYLWRRQYAMLASVRSLLAVWVAAVLMALPAAFPYLILCLHSPFHHDFGMLRACSGELADFIIGNPHHFLVGHLIQRLTPASTWYECSLYLGIMPLVLAFAGIRKASPQLRALVFTGVVGAMLVTGPTLKFMGKELRVSSGNFERSLSQVAGRHVRHVPIPAPGLVLAALPPVWHIMRTTPRFGWLTILACAAAAGVGWAKFTSALSSRNRHLALAGVIAIIAFEYWSSPIPLVKFTPAAADNALQSLPGQGAVVYLPPEENVVPTILYRQEVHCKPLMGGYSTFVPPAAQTDLAGFWREFPHGDWAPMLNAHQVEFVVLLTDRPAHFHWSDAARALSHAGYTCELKCPEYAIYRKNRLQK